MTLSREFLISLKLDERPAYRIAQDADVDPVVLSKLIHGIIPVRRDDERILRVAKIFGLEDDQVFSVE